MRTVRVLVMSLALIAPSLWPRLLPIAAQGGNPPPQDFTNHAFCTERQLREQWVCADPIILPVGADKRTVKREDYQLTESYS